MTASPARHPQSEPLPPAVRQPIARRPMAAAGAGTLARPNCLRQLVWWATVGHLAFVLAAVGLVCVDAERTWLGTLATFAPRQMWLLPGLVLLPASIRIGWRPATANLVLCLWVLFAVSGFSVGAVRRRLPAFSPLVRAPAASEKTARATAADGRAEALRPTALTVASINVQQFDGDLATLLVELSRFDPDVITLQEAVTVPRVLRRYLSVYYWVHDGEFLIAARHPLHPLDRVRVPETDRQTALVAELDCDGQAVTVATVHLETPRKGFEALSPAALLRGDTQAAIRLNTFVRQLESARTAANLRRLAGNTPLIVTGDWNTPLGSRVFEPWEHLRSTFAAAGWGFGYTAPASPRRRWLPGLAWVRIDHILVSSHWHVARAVVGTANGSDHKLVVAEVRLDR